MQLGNGAGTAGGDFLKPADHQNAMAILLEPTKILRDQPGKFGSRDILVADVTVFKTKDTVEGTEAPLVLQAQKITGKVLVEDHEDKVGKEATVGRFVALPNSKGTHPIWAIRPVDQAVFERVAAYVAAREKALTEAMDDEPDWMSA